MHLIVTVFASTSNQAVAAEMVDQITTQHGKKYPKDLIKH